MDKYIFHKKKALDHKTCDHIVTLFEKSNPQYHEHDYHLVISSLLDIRYDFLRLILNNSLQEYSKKHTFLGKREKHWGLSTEFNIQKYDPGHYYDSDKDVVYWEGHCEHGGSDYDCKRILAWMFYLNDIKKDGGTRFPQQNFTTRPRAGDLYIWPASWTHSHYGIPAPKETKYIITGWGSYNE